MMQPAPCPSPNSCRREPVPRRRPGAIVALLASLFVAAAASAPGEEVTVKNDSWDPVTAPTAVVVGGFAAGEKAAVWLTSPCDGDIVAVQVLWGTNTPGAEPSIQNAISIWEAGTFPTPGELLLEIEGPQLTPSALNEFRYLDDTQQFPIRVPVTAGQTVVVSLEFEDPAIDPSVVRDINGCQSGRNGLFAIPGGWMNFCSFLSGDLVIRMVVDCGEAADPAVAFASAASTVGEGDGLASVEVRLDQPAPAGGATVQYAVSGGTATPGGVDFTLLGNGTLTFAQNETTKLVGLLLVDDAVYDPDETIELTLSEPTGCDLGTPATHTITITDNDPEPAPPPSGLQVR